ncbi:MAG: TRAP transporter small permease [Betaproteobacteria bacterium]
MRDGGAARPRSWFDVLIDALAIIAGALIVLLMALVVVDVVARSLRVFTLPWSLEATEYMLYAVTFLGAPWVLRERGHIAIELVVERLPARGRAVAGIIAELAGAAICALLLYYACRVVWQSYQSGIQVQKSFSFPEWVVYTGIAPVMLILLGIYLRWLAARRTGRPAS